MKYITYYELLKMIKDDYKYDTNKAPKNVVFKGKTYKKYLDDDGIAYYGSSINGYLIDDISKEKTEDDIITEYSIAIKIEEEFESLKRWNK